jgi:2-polyprenyl-3-methyl-5-hydroxy-6-metoxy-1,4-benzoquinol methylase
LLAFYASHEYRAEHGPVPITISGEDGSRTYDPRHADTDSYSERAKRDQDYAHALETMGKYRVTWTSDMAGLVRNMRILEIGSGDGYTLREYAFAGMRCTGIEPDDEEARLSSERCPPSVRIIAEPFDRALPELDPPYDAIVAFHVLEHLDDPIAVLRQWCALLTPRGALCVEVPNILAPSLPLDSNHFQWVHLFDFSAHTLIGCLISAGLEPIQVVAAGPNIRCACRPAATAPEYQMGHGGAYVQGYLDAIRKCHGEAG